MVPLIRDLSPLAVATAPGAAFFCREQPMRLLLTACQIFLCSAIASGASALGDTPMPVKVFILAGQSNMEGQAVVDLKGKDYNDGKGTLEQLMSNPEKSPIFRHLKDSDGKWAVRQDVW